LALREPTEHRVTADGVELAFFEWGKAHRGRGPTLLLVHATGFHARCWDPVVRQLADRHVIAVDQRSHGRSEKIEIRHWDVFGRDLVALVRALGLEDLVGVGHSMGAHALVDAAAALRGPFQRLVLTGGWMIQMPGSEPHPTAKRKRHFVSAEAMIERFHDRPPFASFDPEALRAYCRHGLLPAPGGGFELACPPEIEASIYMTSRTNPGVHDSIRSLDLPVLLLRARLPPAERTVMDFSSSPTWPALVGEFSNGREIHFAERSHFLPMEIPGEVAALIEAEVAG
jgi:pimeloyl-ACP methyl ester carboxylesterase